MPQKQLEPPTGIRFRQLSASLTDSTCGVTEDEDIRCWGGRVAKKQHTHHPGRYIQVSVGRGVSMCAITVRQINNSAFQYLHILSFDYRVSFVYSVREPEQAEDHALQCFGPLQSISKADPGREWAEVVVGYLAACAVDMYSNLRCWGIGGAQKPPSDIVIA